MKLYHIASIMLLLLVSACGESVDKSIMDNQELMNADKVKNSKLYYNPISADKPLSPDEAAKMEFEELVFDFGTVVEGESVEHVFKFKNIGKAPLSIGSAVGSCGCTVPQWPKEPILPGESGEIKVAFNSTNKSGRQEKDVTLTANTIPGQTVLKIVARVVKQ